MFTAAARILTETEAGLQKRETSLFNNEAICYHLRADTPVLPPIVFNDITRKIHLRIGGGESKSNFRNSGEE